MSNRGRALWFLVFWAIVGVASYTLGVQSAVGQAAEASVLQAAEFTTDPPAPLNLVSIPNVAIALVAVGLIAFFSHGIRRALVVTAVPAAAILISQLLKLQVLDRPDLLEFDMANTFPSGHMTVFTAVASALIWAVPNRLRIAAAGIGGLSLGAVGWQLLAYGWHRPSDVVGALALGTAAFAVASLIGPSRRPGPTTPDRITSRTLGVVGWALVAVALGVASYAAIGSHLDLMLTAGQIGVIGTSALSVRTTFLLGLASRRGARA